MYMCIYIIYDSWRWVLFFHCYFCINLQNFYFSSQEVLLNPAKSFASCVLCFLWSMAEGWPLWLNMTMYTFLHNQTGHTVWLFESDRTTQFDPLVWSLDTVHVQSIWISTSCRSAAACPGCTLPFTPLLLDYSITNHQKQVSSTNLNWQQSYSFLNHFSWITVTQIIRGKQ